MKLHEADPFINPEKYVGRAISLGMNAFKNWDLRQKVYVCNTLLDEIEDFAQDVDFWARLESNMQKIGVSPGTSRLYGSEQLIKFCQFKEPENEDINASLQVCTFLPTGELYLAYEAVWTNKWQFVPPTKCGEGFRMIYKNYYSGKMEQEKLSVLQMMGSCYIIMFLEFVDVEMHEVAHNSKYSPRSGHDVKNRTGEPLLIADRNWHREIHRDTPFAVRGHWRMQPYGKGRKRIKLIWIKAHQRSGYHREAGKESLN